MKLVLEWLKPIPLRDATRENLIYSVALDKLPTLPGIYVLGRRWGKQFEALYVGKATGIRGRVKNQYLKNAKAGRRIVLAGRISTKPGQQLDRCLPLIERALIRYFLSEGHDLVNKQGTRLRRHEVLSSGKHPKGFIPGLMYLGRGKHE